MARIINTEKCVGCKTCEIACSYHHRNIFSPAIASIEVIRNEREGKVGIKVYRNLENGHMACNCTSGEEFCLGYCHAATRNELKAILSSS